MPTLLITGASGTVGAATVAALLARRDPDLTLRLAGRDPAALRERFGADARVEAVALDYADSGTFATATRGADAAFLLGPPLDKQLDELLAPFVDHLAAAGPRRVVLLSAYGAERIGYLRRVLERARAADFDLTVLQPGFFATNYGLYDRESIEQRGVIYQAAGAGRTAYVSAADVGRVAAAALTEAGHVGRTYVLTGPELHSIAQIAGMLSEIRGREVRYVAAAPEEYRATLAAAGAPPQVADYMLPIYALVAEGHVAEVSDAVERITGRPPEPLRSVLERDFAPPTA